MRALSRKVLRLALAAGLLATACAHAPPVTGSRDPQAAIDPDYPEINCNVNNTADCRPSAY
jgi:hypothetical protein